MPNNKSTQLWENSDQEEHFQDLKLQFQQQSGPHCVSTCLAMLTGQAPSFFQGKMNTQNPVSWSDVLQPFGMKLAYCPTDIRKLKWYQEELLEINDLFLLCYYISSDPEVLLRDPDDEGWICGSHVVILHQGVIFDPGGIGAIAAARHSCWEHHTKRIFRILPVGHKRGL